MPLIRFEAVTKTFGDKGVLRGFSAALPTDGIVALMGPSGSGKTTLARLLLGLAQPDAGRILGREGLRFGCVFQEDRLCPGLSALENVCLVLPHPDIALARDTLFALGLAEEELHKPARELSGGQKRRVALARALVAPADYVVLDEPFNGLDDASKGAAVRTILAKLCGRGALLITHQAEDAAALGAQMLRL